MTLPMSSYGYVERLAQLQEQVTRLTAALRHEYVAVADLQPGDRVVLTRTVVTTIEVCEGRRMVIFQHEEGQAPTLTCGAQATFRRAGPSPTTPDPSPGRPQFGAVSSPTRSSCDPQGRSERVTRMGFDR